MGAEISTSIMFEYEYLPLRSICFKRYFTKLNPGLSSTKLYECLSVVVPFLSINPICSNSIPTTDFSIAKPQLFFSVTVDQLRITLPFDIEAAKELSSTGMVPAGRISVE